MENSELIQEKAPDTSSTLLLSPEGLESSALKRILAEVADDRIVGLVPNRYDRDHNRHNR